MLVVCLGGGGAISLRMEWVDVCRMVTARAGQEEQLQEVSVTGRVRREEKVKKESTVLSLISHLSESSRL